MSDRDAFAAEFLEAVRAMFQPPYVRAVTHLANRDAAFRGQILNLWRTWKPGGAWDAGRQRDS